MVLFRAFHRFSIVGLVVCGVALLTATGASAQTVTAPDGTLAACVENVVVTNGQLACGAQAVVDDLDPDGVTHSNFGGSTAIGIGAFANGSQATAIGDLTRANFDGVAVGAYTNVRGLGAVGIGKATQGAGDYATAVGWQADAHADHTVAIGGVAFADGVGAIALGYMATGSGTGSVAMGLRSSTFGPDTLVGANLAVAIGSDAGVTRNGGVSIGANSSVTAVNSVALGLNAHATAANSVAIGTDAIADAPSTVSVGAPGAERRITNVAPGVARTDAATFGQLQDAIAGTNSQIALLRSDMSDAVAASTALGGIMVPSGPGKTTFSTHAGFYGGSEAIGFNVAHRLDVGGDMPVMVDGGFASTLDGRNQVGRVGFSVEF
ncbi:MAG TPA: hypothetical protein VII56_16125 [Rhizomicrobium sp.]